MIRAAMRDLRKRKRGNGKRSPVTLTTRNRCAICVFVTFMYFFSFVIVSIFSPTHSLNHVQMCTFHIFSPVYLPSEARLGCTQEEIGRGGWRTECINSRCSVCFFHAPFCRYGITADRWCWVFWKCAWVCVLCEQFDTALHYLPYLAHCALQRFNVVWSFITAFIQDCVFSAPFLLFVCVSFMKNILWQLINPFSVCFCCVSQSDIKYK